MPDSEKRLMVTLTVDELEQVIDRAVDRMIAKVPTTAEVLTPDEAAELLRLTPKTLIRHTESRGLPVHWAGSERRYKRSELLEWLAAQKPPARKAG